MGITGLPDRLGRITTTTITIMAVAGNSATTNTPVLISTGVFYYTAISNSSHSPLIYPKKKKAGLGE